MQCRHFHYLTVAFTSAIYINPRLISRLRHRYMSHRAFLTVRTRVYSRYKAVQLHEIES